MTTVSLGIFTESNLCKCGAACGVCRDPARGPAWHALQASRGFVYPEGWACPKGLAVGWKPEPKATAPKPEKVWTVKDRSRGIGDVVAKITSAVGIKPCGGCAKRQAILNDLLPLR